VTGRPSPEATAPAAIATQLAIITAAVSTLPGEWMNIAVRPLRLEIVVQSEWVLPHERLTHLCQLAQVLGAPAVTHEHDYPALPDRGDGLARDPWGQWSTTFDQDGVRITLWCVGPLREQVEHDQAVSKP
jgi:hypothetical protein